jgi:hypothetical protein
MHNETTTAGTEIETPSIEETAEGYPGTSGLPADDHELGDEMAAAFGWGAEQSPEEIEAEYQWYLAQETERAERTLTEQLIERTCAWGARFDEINRVG